MKIHPYANLFPMCSDEEVQQLADDIAKNGLRQPIVIDKDEMILDGRNRSAACAIAQVTPIYEPFVGNDAEKLAYVVSVNVHRRHLTTQQRADIAAKIATMKVGDNQHDKKKKEGPSNDGGSPKVSAKQAAKLMNVSTSSVERAKAKSKPDKPKSAKSKPDHKPTETKPAESNSPSMVTDATLALFGGSSELKEEDICDLFQKLFDKLSPDQAEQVCQNCMDRLGWKREKKNWQQKTKEKKPRPWERSWLSRFFIAVDETTTTQQQSKDHSKCQTYRIQSKNEYGPADLSKLQNGR